MHDAYTYCFELLDSDSKTLQCYGDSIVLAHDSGGSRTYIKGAAVHSQAQGPKFEAWNWKAESGGLWFLGRGQRATSNQLWVWAL